MRMIFTNDFHKTKAVFDCDSGDVVTPRRMRALRNRLCGSNECTCSGNSGMRGKQVWPVMFREMESGHFVVEVVAK